ncbi:MAG: HAD family hydrolase [Balneolales bacterium]
MSGTSALTTANSTTDFSRVKYIYFDLDDTLINHKKAQQQALVDVWSQFPLLQQIKPEKLITVYGRVNDRLWEAYRNNEINRSELKYRRIKFTFEELKLELRGWQDIDTVYRDCYQRHWDWIADARQTFISLSRRYSVGIMTNGFTDTQKQKFEYLSLHRYAQHLIISEETGYLKPDPKIFEYAAKKAGYEPAELLYVGDSYLSDIVGGARSGWKTAWYLPDNKTHPLSQESGNPEADLIFHHFSQLENQLNGSSG